MWHDIIYTDVEQSFNEIDAIFPKPEDGVDEYNRKIELLSKKLLKEANDRKLGSQSLLALTLSKQLTPSGKKKFNIPLFDPIHASRNEALLGSLFKNNVIKQKINGGNLTMSSSVGFSNKLEYKITDGRLEYVEAYLPHWSEKMFEPFIDKATGIVDTSKIKDKPFTTVRTIKTYITSQPFI